MAITVNPSSNSGPIAAGPGILDKKADAYVPTGTLNSSVDLQNTSQNRWDSDTFARRTVVQEYREAAQWRKFNHDHRWDEAERLYLAWYPQRTWPGSREPRSCLGVPITFEQIESMKPRMVSAIFGDERWFEVDGRMGTAPKIGSVVENILGNQLEYSNPREVVRRGVNSALLLGNGIIELYWDYQKRQDRRYVPTYVPSMQRIVDPITGESFRQPTGEYDVRWVDKTIETVINRPAMRYVSVRDFFIDVHCPSVVPKEARYVTKRILMNMDDILALKGVGGFDVPSRDELMYLVNFDRPVDESDMSRTAANAQRFVNYQPAANYTADPGIGRIEVLIRHSKDRLVWVVGKSLVIYNHPHPFGHIPFYNIFYADLTDRFYGLSIADVVEGEQRFQANLLNKRVDELSLAIDPPTVTTNDRFSTYELRYRPSNVVKVTNPATDVQRQFPQNITQQAFVEAQQSDIRVQRITGQNESIMQGVPTPSNPIARSAAGANMQQAASMSRLVHNVENIEDLALEPLVADAWELDKQFLSPKEMQDFAKAGKVSLMDLFNGQVKPYVRAGSRMMARSILAQEFPLIMQSVANAGVMQELRQQGMTVDWQEMFRILFDATGYSTRGQIIRPLNDQEKQAVQQRQQAEQQQQQAEVQAELQKQRERLTSLSGMQQDKGTMDFVRDIVRTMLQNQKEGKPIETGIAGLLGGMMSGQGQGGPGQGQTQGQGPGQSPIVNPMGGAGGNPINPGGRIVAPNVGLSGLSGLLGSAGGSGMVQ